MERRRVKVCRGEAVPHTLSGSGEFPEGKMYLVFLDMNPIKAKWPSPRKITKTDCEDGGHPGPGLVPSLSVTVLGTHRQTHSLLQLYSDQEETLECSSVVHGSGSLRPSKSF